MSRRNPDAIVVGAGLAGAAAARELRLDGRVVLMLEARDRVGGRTFSTERNGRLVELGGAFVHWWQSQSFAEVQRYGLELELVPWLAESCYWPTATGPKRGSIAALREVLVPLLDRFFVDAKHALPYPFEPLTGDRQQDLDRLSVEDRLADMGVTDEERMIVAGLISAMCSGKPSEVGLVSALRWQALHRWDSDQFMDREHYKIRGGVKRLTEAILRDAACEVRLETPVASVAQNGRHVTVVTRSGDELESRAVVIAVPLSALRGIVLPSDAPSAWLATARDGAASEGFKVVMRASPESPNVLAIGGQDAPITWMVPDSPAPEGGVMFSGFGPDSRTLDTNDLASVQAAVKLIAPEVSIVEAHGHDWLADEYSRGTWGLLRPGQLTSSLEELCRPWGGMMLACSEIANGWATYMAGAIESGVRAGRQARAVLATDAELKSPPEPQANRP